MAEEIDDVMYENIDWSLHSKQPSEWEKEYPSLLEEMKEKSKPSNFCNPECYDERRVEIAIEIYEVVQSGSADDETLRMLRNRAIDELGVVFSSKKLYEELMKYCNVKIYEEMQPFDAARIREANHYCQMINDARHDIRKLEQVEAEAKDFIERRKNEIPEAEEEERRKREEEERKKMEEEERRKRDGEVVILILILSIFVLFCMMYFISLIIV